VTAQSEWPPPKRLPDAVIRAAMASAFVLLTVATIVRLWSRGGPYLDAPRTIVDHVDRMDAPWVANPTRTPLEVIPRLARFIPRGAEVACFRPLAGQQQYDTPSFLTAIGQLPRNRVLPAFTARLDTPPPLLAEYVIAIDEPFTHPAYRLLAEVPGGRLYKVER
jgi:hypothetical protein